MKKSIIKVWDLPSSGSNLVLFVLAAAFFIGSLAGCIFAAQVDGIGNDAMSDYLTAYLSEFDVNDVNAFSLLWDIVQWPLFLLVLGLTPVGLIGIPALFVIRGFLISFSVASFYRVYDLHGLLLALVVFGITGLFYIPVLFILGVQGFLTSGNLTSRLLGETKSRPVIERTGYIRIAMCAAVLCVCYLIELRLIPVLLLEASSLI